MFGRDDRKDAEGNGVVTRVGPIRPARSLGAAYPRAHLRRLDFQPDDYKATSGILALVQLQDRAEPRGRQVASVLVDAARQGKLSAEAGEALGRMDYYALMGLVDQLGDMEVPEAGVILFAERQAGHGMGTGFALAH